MKNYLIIFFFGLLLLPSLTHAQKNDLKPLVVFIERNPWNMVIGSDSPQFALYDNGLLIYLDKNYEKYRHITLPLKEKEEFLESLNINKLFSINKPLILDESTDQPTNLLFIQDKNKASTITLYGDLTEESILDKTPSAFYAAYQKIISYKNDLAKFWLPEKIEVMIWPFEHSTKEPLEWPTGWPDKTDTLTKKRKDGAFSIYLDANLLKELRSLENSSVKSNQSVMINGGKYSILHRYTFPAESEWMK